MLFIWISADFTSLKAVITVTMDEIRTEGYGNPHQYLIWLCTGYDEKMGEASCNLSEMSDCQVCQ